MWNTGCRVESGLRLGTWFIVWVVCIVGSVTAQERLRLATTTSTDNSGLLTYLLPDFQQRFRLKVDVIAVGTGQALRLGENGDVDVVLVHAPVAEADFVQAGFGVNRRAVMANDFIILGPLDDPARIRGQASAVEVLRRLAAQRALFISRGDDSGTHKKEQILWQQSGGVPRGQSWYLEVGQGMGATLQMAHEKQAYTLADRGTYLTYRNQLALQVVHEGDALYDNPYSIIAVNPKRHPHVQYRHAMALINWLTSTEGQQRIGRFRRYGQVLFRPSSMKLPR